MKQKGSLRLWKKPVSNYPDDIEDSKDDPMSPLFEPPIEWCEYCDYMINENGECDCD